jgi:hypothetical protein
VVGNGVSLNGFKTSPKLHKTTPLLLALQYTVQCIAWRGIQPEPLLKTMVETLCLSNYCLPFMETESLLPCSQNPHLDLVLEEKNLIYILKEIEREREREREGAACYLTKLSVPKITRRWWYEVFVIEY